MSQIINRSLNSDFMPVWIGFRQKNIFVSPGQVHNALILNTVVLWLRHLNVQMSGKPKL